MTPGDVLLNHGWTTVQWEASVLLPSGGLPMAGCCRYVEGDLYRGNVLPAEEPEPEGPDRAWEDEYRNHSSSHTGL